MCSTQTKTVLEGVSFGVQTNTTNATYDYFILCSVPAAGVYFCSYWEHTLNVKCAQEVHMYLKCICVFILRQIMRK